MGMMESVRKHRQMPWLKRGMRIEYLFNGKLGRVAGGNDSGNIDVIMDGEKHSGNYHPKWKMRYIGKDGKTVAIYS